MLDYSHPVELSDSFIRIIQSRFIYSCFKETVKKPEFFQRPVN